MFRFNKTGYITILVDGDIFKYIVCFGSIFAIKEYKKITGKFKYIVCFGSIPIIVVHFHLIVLFKYIVCFGSIHQTMKLLRGFLLNLNTLYVSVQ